MGIDAQFSLWDQARNTALVRRSAQTIMEQQVRPARQLSTMVPTTDDKIKLERMEIAAAGVAPLKAIGASDPIYAPRVRWTETAVELVQISEQRPIDERLLRQLENTDPKLVERAGVDILTTASQMEIRNANRSDLMVMTAVLTGQLPLIFEDEPDQGITIVYDYDPTHLVDASTWSNPTSGTPIADMVAVQELLANASGGYGIHFWMNSETGRDMIWTNEAKALLTGFDGRAQFIPNYADLTRRMFESDQVQFHITNSGWRSEGSYARGRDSHNKWIPDGKVIVTTADPFEGENLVEMFDGLVLVRTGFDTHVLRQGSQTQAKLDDADTYYWKQTSTRIPRINRPECIAVMDVS